MWWKSLFASLVVGVLLTAAAVVFTPAVFAADDEKKAETEEKIIPSAEAKDHMNEEVTVEMTVAAGRTLADKGLCFLNSESDFKSDGNFTAFIGKVALQRFAEKDIKDPYEHFKGKKVRVKGKIVEHKGKPEIVVEEVDQIKLVDEDKEEKKEEPKT